MKISTANLIASLMLAAVPSVASAAWGTLETPSSIYSNDGEIGVMKTARTADGKTYVSWLQWSEQSGWGYDLHLQLLDANGNPMWDEESLAVETRRNASWTADYSLVVASDGDAVISWADARSEEDAETAYAHEPVLYRINQNQEYVWGDDGITLGDAYKFPPTLYRIGDYIYAILLSSDDYTPSKITRINDDGSFAFDPIEFAGHLAQSEGNDFIAVYGSSQGTVAMRFNENLERQWQEEAVVSEYIYNGYARNPYRIKPDGQGGVAVTFARALDFTHLPIVQHISSDGEATFGPSVDIIPEENMIGDYDYPVIAVNPDTETIITTWNQHGAGTAAVGGQLFDYFGERLWGDNGINLAEKEASAGYSYGPIEMHPLNDDQWLLCYADELWWAHSIIHLACFDNDGKEIWNYWTPMELSVSNPSTDFSDGIFSLTYVNEVTDDNWNTTYTIENIRFDTKTVGIGEITSSATPGRKEYFTIDGKKTPNPVKGLNIIRNGDGSVSKVFLK